MADQPACDQLAHERAFTATFVVAQKRDRTFTLLCSRKRRREILDRLHHKPDLKPQFLHRISPGDQDHARIIAMLRAAGAGAQCWAISSNPQIDGRLLPIEKALDAILGLGFGSVLSCVPGELAYYEGENPDQRFLLRKR